MTGSHHQSCVGKFSAGNARPGTMSADTGYQRRATMMATLTIPDKLYEQLAALAAEKQRSVDEYSIEALEKVASDDAQAGAPLTRDEQLRRIHEVMGDRIWTQDDIDAFFEGLGIPEMSAEEAEQIIATIPPLDPPLSQTVIEMRDEERY